MKEASNIADALSEIENYLIKRYDLTERPLGKITVSPELFGRILGESFQFPTGISLYADRLDINNLQIVKARTDNSPTVLEPGKLL